MDLLKGWLGLSGGLWSDGLVGVKRQDGVETNLSSGQNIYKK